MWIGKRVSNLAAGALAAGLFLTILSGGAAAQVFLGAPPTANKLSMIPPETQGNTLATSHVLKGTYFNSGNWGGTFFPGNADYSVDNQLTVACPGTTTCTIEADMWVEEGWASAASTGGLCFDVDNGAEFYCWDSHYIDELYPNVGSFSQIYSYGDLKPGTHTVQTYLYSGSGTDVWQYYITYHVYAP